MTIVPFNHPDKADVLFNKCSEIVKAWRTIVVLDAGKLELSVSVVTGPDGDRYCEFGDRLGPIINIRDDAGMAALGEFLMGLQYNLPEMMLEGTRPYLETVADITFRTST